MLFIFICIFIKKRFPNSCPTANTLGSWGPLCIGDSEFLELSEFDRDHATYSLLVLSQYFITQHDSEEISLLRALVISLPRFAADNFVLCVLNMSPSLRKPYDGTQRRIVIAFDLGTTWSGISYRQACIQTVSPSMSHNSHTIAF